MKLDRTLQEIEKSINDIVEIEFDWDERRGFEKPTELTLTNAIKIVKELLPQ